MKRYALIRAAGSRSTLEAYLPANYEIVHEGYFEDSRTWHVFVIQGEDVAGWTLDDYVKPRLLSGLIGCEEIDLSHPIMKEVPAWPTGTR